MAGNEATYRGQRVAIHKPQDYLKIFSFKRKDSDEDKLRWLNLWAETAQEKNYKPGWVYARYEGRYGERCPDHLRARVTAASAKARA